MPKRKNSAPAKAENSLTGLFGDSGSLTASLFGGSADTGNGNDSIFGSSSTNFDKAVKDRVEENKARAKKSKPNVEEEVAEGEDTLPAQEESDDEILTRRQDQSQTDLVDDITCEPIYPANDSEACLEAAAAAAALTEEGPLPIDVQIQDAVDVVQTNGFAVIQNVVSKETLDVIAERAHEIEKQICAALDDRKIPWRADNKAETFRFHEVASRCTGRMDLRYETSKPPFSNSDIVENKSIIPIVHSLLGGATAREEAHMPILVYVGLIVSLPGSDDQPWHQDGMPLFTEQSDMVDIPPYALNVFLPLTDDDAAIESGPTEFIPGSHRLSEDKVMEAVDRAEKREVTEKDEDDESDDEELPGIAGPILRQGDALIYDYRVCHRGTSNITNRVAKDGKGRARKILYLMFARPWFREHLNFGKEKLF